MEKGWERSTPVYELAREDLERIVEAAFPGAQLLAGERLSGGLANTNYRLEISAQPGPVVLRVYTRDPEACTREAVLLDSLGASVPAPRVLYRDVSGTVIAKPFLIESWLPGTRLQDVLDDGRLLVALGAPLGRMAARIGAIRFESPGFFAPSVPLRPAENLPSLASYVAACLDSTPARGALGDTLCLELQTFVAANQRYFDFDGDARLVHGDYKPSNLLIDPEQRAVAGVLDWEFAFAGPPLYDLATLLRDSDSSPPAYESAVASGFVEGGGELPEDWKRRIRLLDFGNLAGFLAQPGEAPARTDDVRRLLVSTLRQWPDLPA